MTSLNLASVVSTSNSSPISYPLSTKLGLSNAGKLMGLCGYGRVIDKWKSPIESAFNNEVTIDELENILNIGKLTEKSIVSANCVIFTVLVMLVAVLTFLSPFL